MSIGISEKRVSYDNPCAPIVKFSKTNSDHDDFDEEDMTDDQSLMNNNNNDTLLNPTLGEHSLKSLSLEDLVKSFDNTINACFADEQVTEFEEESKTPQEDLIASSKFVLFLSPI